MKTHTQALLDLLNDSDQCLYADLMFIVTSTGAEYRYTNADIDLDWDGETWIATDILFKRGSIRTVRGTEVSELSITAYARPENTIGGVAFMKALFSGALDAAYITVWRAYLSSWEAGIVGVIKSFEGRVSEIGGGRTEATLTVKSAFELLNIKMPRNLYQPGCVHTLYDGGCGLSKNTFGVPLHIATGSTQTTLYSEDGFGNQYFALGTVTFTSGENNGVTRTIRSYTAGVMVLSYPLPFVPVVGDTFTAFPGCDKLKATCSGKFNNLANFRGFPFIPVPETSV